jgi:hypothetical protein
MATAIDECVGDGCWCAWILKLHSTKGGLKRKKILVARDCKVLQEYPGSRGGNSKSGIHVIWIVAIADIISEAATVDKFLAPKHASGGVNRFVGTMTWNHFQCSCPSVHRATERTYYISVHRERETGPGESGRNRRMYSVCVCVCVCVCVHRHAPSLAWATARQFKRSLFGIHRLTSFFLEARSLGHDHQNLGTHQSHVPLTTEYLV